MPNLYIYIKEKSLVYGMNIYCNNIDSNIAFVHGGGIFNKVTRPYRKTC